jgi:hypothetical protein
VFSIVTSDIIAVNLFSTIQSHHKPKNLFFLLLNTCYPAMRNATELYLQAADILIAPATSTYNVVGTRSVPLRRVGVENA